MSPADSAPQKFSHALAERHLGVRAKRMNVFYCLQTAPAPMTLRQLGQTSEASVECVASTIELMLELGLAKEVDPVPPARCPYCSQNVHVCGGRLRWQCDRYHVGRMERSYAPTEEQVVT